MNQEMQLMGELYRRGQLPPDQAQIYEELQRRQAGPPPMQAPSPAGPSPAAPPHMGNAPGPDIGDIGDIAGLLGSAIPPMLPSSLLSPGGARAFQQGESFYTSDELKGLAAVATGGDYQETVDKERAKLAQFSREHPYRSFAAEAAGSLAFPVGTGTALVSKLGGGAAGKIGAGAAVNALQGGLAGA